MAQGVYYPDEGVGQTEDSIFAAFDLPAGVKLYGGFKGSEAEVTQRSPFTQLSILSGDLQQDDLDQDGNRISEVASDIRGSNAETVVTIFEGNDQTGLDGFVVTAGNANNAETLITQRRYAGGIYLENGTPFLARCRIVGNRCIRDGAGIYGSRAGPVITNSVISGNHSEQEGGGIGLRQGAADVTVQDCLVAGNTAGRAGGGLYLLASSVDSHPLTVTGCTILANTAGNDGGGVWGVFEDTVIANSIIWANVADRTTSSPSASVYTPGSTKGTISHSLVANSTGALGASGVMALDGGNNLDEDPRFALTPTPGIPIQPEFFHLLAGSPGIDAGSNALLAPDGADLDHDDDRSAPSPYDLLGGPRVVGSTVDLGAVEAQGGGPVMTAPLEPLRFLAEPQVHQNAVQLAQHYDDSAMSYELIAIAPNGVVVPHVDSNTGIVSIEVLPAQLGRVKMVFAARSASGQTSFGSLEVDVFPPAVRVSANALPDGNGLTWDTALDSLQDALALGGSGYEIWVAGGVYYPDRGAGIPGGDPEMSFRLPDRVPLFGGFAGTESDRAERDPTRHPTILSGDLGQDDFDRNRDGIIDSVADHRGENSLAVVRGSEDGGRASLDGFIITAGHGDDTNGGGLHARADDELHVTNCRFIGNVAEWGGALSVSGDATVRLTSCEFRKNEAVQGGAAYFSSTRPTTLVGCRMRDNTAEERGGAVYAESASGHFVNCVLAGNQAEYGGAVYSRESPLVSINTIYARNEAISGGAIGQSGSAGPIINSNFTGNVAQYGGALNIFYWSQSVMHTPLTVRNSIFWSNQATRDPATNTASVSTQLPELPSFSHCLIEGSASDNWNAALGSDLGGNIDLDPLFLKPVDPVLPFTDSFDLRLRPESPAFNRAPASSLPADDLDLDGDGDPLEPLPLDHSGNPRLAGASLDLGPYELEPGPAVVGTLDSIHLEPDSGLHAGLLDPAALFDASAVEFRVVDSVPSGILTGAIDPATGLLTLTVQPRRIGLVSVVIAATDASGGTSLRHVPVNVIPSIVRVDADAAGEATGASWEDAMPFLHDALALKLLTGIDVEIWVAEGEHRASGGNSTLHPYPNTKFTVPDGIALYGGFAGHEQRRGERDPAMHPTILRGAWTGILAASVIAPGANPVIDGFVFEGNGLELRDSAPLVRQCRFSGIDNIAVRIYRGAPRFEACRFVTNRSDNEDAAVRAISSNLDFTGCVFEDNHSSVSDSVFFVENEAGEAVTLRDCRFVGNQTSPISGSRPGITLRLKGGNLLLSGCEFAGNGRGALLAEQFPPTTVRAFNCRFVGNSGGAASLSSTSAEFFNCLFAGNYAEYGAAISSGTGTLTLTNCTLSGNNATGGAGGAFASSSSLVVRNSIIWNNRSHGSTTDLAASVGKPASWQSLDAEFSDCIIANSGGSANWNDVFGRDSGNNFDVDPRFLNPIDPRQAPSTEGDYRIGAGSPTIDAGDSLGLPADSLDLDGDNDLDEPLPVDLAGSPRVIGTGIDLGASEVPAGPAMLQPVAEIEVPPNSGAHPAIANLAEAFDNTATEFELLSTSEPEVATGHLDPATGQFDLTVQPGKLGTTRFVVAATGADATSHAVITVTVRPPEVLFVDATATGTGSGLSWSNAFPTLQEALAVAREGTEIWVAAGVYFPNEGIDYEENQRIPRFRLVKGVPIYGGFSGAESTRDQRDPTRHRAVLSGDLDRNDRNADGNGIAETTSDLVGTNAGTVIHVGWVGPETILDGLTITAGDATADSGRDSGGAMFIEHSGPTVVGCTFAGNRAESMGGAIFLDYGVEATFRACTFTGNSADSGGAAAFGNQAIATFVDCSFTANRAVLGGALRVTRTASLHLSNSSLAGNRAKSGGAVSAQDNALLRIINCNLSGNFASSGGGLSDESDESVIVNSVFTGNAGGAVRSHSFPGPHFSNCIIWNNWLDPTLPAREASLNGNGRFESCLVAHSGGSENWDGGIGRDLGNNLDADPRFVAPFDPRSAPTVSGNVQLRAGSPAVDAGLAPLPADATDLDQDGDRDEPLPLDLAQRPRVLGAAPDLGPFEHAAGGPGVVQPAPTLKLAPNSGSHPAIIDLRDVFDPSAVSFAIDTIVGAHLVAASVDPVTGILDLEIQADRFGDAWIAISATNPSGVTSLTGIKVEVFPSVVFVDASATGKGSGFSWEDAFPDLQSALKGGASHYEIWVAQGTYYPDVGPGTAGGDPDSTFLLVEGCRLYGGFAAWESERTQRDWTAFPTILSGSLFTRVDSTTAERAVHAVDAGSIELDGFSIAGSSVECQRSALLISNTRFTNMRLGLFGSDSSVILTRCGIEGCREALSATGDSELILRDCLIYANATSSEPTINVGSDASLTFVNCTIAGNRSDRRFDSLIVNRGALVCRNSILWNNNAAGSSSDPPPGIGYTIKNFDAGTASFSHSIVEHSGGSANWNPEAGTDFGGNLDTDPRFLLPAQVRTSSSNIPGYPFLDAGSPAIDTGSNAFVSNATDLSGRARLANGTVDMGAFEAQGDELDSDDDGLSDWFERQHTTPPSATALDPAADLDLDGLVNLMEFALGGDPHRSDASELVRISLAPSGSSDTSTPGLSLTYRTNVWATKYIDLEVVRSVNLGLSDQWNTKNFRNDSTTILDYLHREIQKTSSRGIFGWGTPQEFLQLQATRK